MDRPINWGQSQARTFDIAGGYQDVLIGQANQAQAILGGTTTVLSGFGATASTPTSLNLTLASGQIYQLADIDATAIGAIAQDLSEVMQQGFAASEQITMSTSGIGVGQSRWSLIEAQFSQVDVIAPSDPTGGLLFFYNSTNVNQPYQGPSNDGQTTPTLRQGVATIQVITGAATTTGSEVPPQPTTGWTPLYLIDLSYGQTAIAQGQILAAGPSVGTGVPNNYPYAPFLAGLLNSHHSGTGGQAPQIKLTSEVQGILPNANLAASNVSGGIPTMRLYGGNPNGHIAGNSNVNGASDICFDTLDGFLYVCTQTGTTTTAVWTNLSSGATANYNGGTTTGTGNAQVVASTTPSGFSLTSGVTVTAVAGFTNTAGTTLNVDGTGAIAIKKNSSGTLVPLTGGEITAGQIFVVTYDGTQYELQAAGLGTAAYQNVSAFYQVSNVLSEIPAANAVGTAQGNLQLLSLTSGGSANAYTLTYSPAPTALVTGQTYSFIANFSTTGAATLNVNGIGAKAITKIGTAALASGDIISGMAVSLRYDGTQFQLLNPTANSAIKSVKFQNFASNGTYTPSSGMLEAIVEIVGGGGRGGSGSGGFGSGGGGSGAYVKVLLTATQVGSSQTVTIGAASTGANAGNTSLGSLITCNGGTDGNYGNSNTEVGGNGGSYTVTTGTLMIGVSGQNGGTAGRTTDDGPDLGGAGGSTPIGAGGPMTWGFGNAATNGSPGTGYGSGSSGAVGTGSPGTPMAGYISITEFCTQ